MSGSTPLLAPDPLAGRGSLPLPQAEIQPSSRLDIGRTLTFTNPILPPHSADPWLILHKGTYYYCESRNNLGIFIRRARTISEIGKDPGTAVWTAPAHGMNSREIWAPELHWIDGRWYIYYAASNGRNETHRMWVLESETDNPEGPYRDCGSLETDGWAIDGTVLQTDDGKLFFIWSGWPGQDNGRQNLYIAPMTDPRTLAGPRTMICSPEERWEKVGMPIAEGPQLLKRNGKIFIVYSASGSWTVDYCLGLLIHRGGDLLDPSSWEKRGPVFQKTQNVWGVGHCSFVKSPDQTEDWIIYHAKSAKKRGWVDRHIHAQRFTWHEDGLPCFGTPISAGVPIPVASMADSLRTLPD